MMISFSVGVNVEPVVPAVVRSFQSNLTKARMVPPGNSSVCV
ncbi:hypothetical protein QFZ50_001448 [Arthrobacter agilis]|jgi:hypothetical protein|nr:hypothetical protein [Arthrobacter agilis]